MTTVFGVRTTPGPLAFKSGTVATNATLEFQDYRPDPRRQQGLTVALSVDKDGELYVDRVKRADGTVLDRVKTQAITGSATNESLVDLPYDLGGGADLRISYKNTAGSSATVGSCRIGEKRGA